MDLPPLSVGVLSSRMVFMSDLPESGKVFRESDAHLRSLLENAQDFVVYRVAVDPSSPYGGRVVLVSPSIRDLLGITEPYRFETWFDNLHPEDRPRVEEANRRSWERGEPYRQAARFYHARRGEWIWVHTMSTPVFDEQGELIHFNGLIVDVTEQKRTEAALQYRIAFENVISAISANFINLAPEEIDAGINQALHTVGIFTGVDRSYVFIFSQDRTHMSCSHEWCAEGIEPAIGRMQAVPVEALRWSNDKLLRLETLHVPRVADLPPEAAAERREFQTQGIRSLVAVPMAYRGRPIGFLGFDAVRSEKHWSAESIELLTMVGQILVNVLERQRAHQELERAYQSLEQRVESRTQEIERRRQVAEGLRDILKVLNSNRPLDEILDYIVSQACRLLGSDAGVIYGYDLDRGLSTAEACAGMPPEFLELSPFPLTQTEPQQAMSKRQPFATRDLKERLRRIKRATPDMPPIMQAWADLMIEHFCSRLAVPLVIKDQLYGAIELYYRQAHQHSAEEVELALAFGDQAAMAIENAYLRNQAEAAAAAAERNRLARDLHDAVSQTLFSASLIAEVLPRLWQRQPDEAARRLEELRQLTRGALAEMRALLVELRPSALAEARLSDLLRQLAEAITGRARMPVRVAVEGECALSPEVRVALYRIAQEGLNNVVKHAGASQVEVRLGCQPGRVELRIRDDGRGFDPEKVPSDHFGLGIMRERAEGVGAELLIDSQLGRGTEIQVVWKEKGNYSGARHFKRSGSAWHLD